MKSHRTLRRILIPAVLFALLLLAVATAARAYVLLTPNHKWGDPDEPVEYRLNVARNESSVPGTAEFDDVRASFQVWQAVGTRMAFYEGPNHTFCDFSDDGFNEVAFDECGGECTGGCLAVTRSLTYDPPDQMWQEGPDGTIRVRAKYDADILFNASTNFWSPVEGNCSGFQFSVVGVATHEIGHVLGLGHSPIGEATMEATIAPCSRIEETLAADDIAGLQQLYSVASEEFVVHEHANGVIAFGVDNAGNFGYTSGGGRWGRGFEAPIGTTNLFEAGFALGTPAAAQLCDDFRVHGPNGQDADFLQRTGITVIDHTDPLQFATTQYDDTRAEVPLGVHVTQRSFLFPAGPDEDYFIMEYRVRNDAAQPIADLHAGIFMDWDLGGFYLNNTCSYDADLGLGWVSDPGTAMQAGACVLNEEGVTSYRALYATGNEASEWYTEDNKKSWFFSGFTRTELVNNDIGMLIVTGPFTVPAGGVASAAFALVSGSDHADLRLNCERAREKYLAVRHFPDDPAFVEGAVGSFRLELGPNRPNPFTQETRIPLSIREAGRVVVQIHDVSGRVVRRLVDQHLAAQEYQVVWDRRDDRGSLLPSGIYFSRVTSSQARAERKLIVLD